MELECSMKEHHFPFPCTLLFSLIEVISAKKNHKGWTMKHRTLMGYHHFVYSCLEWCLWIFLSSVFQNGLRSQRTNKCIPCGVHNITKARGCQFWKSINDFFEVSRPIIQWRYLWNQINSWENFTKPVCSEVDPAASVWNRLLFSQISASVTRNLMKRWNSMKQIVIKFWNKNIFLFSFPI